MVLFLSLSVPALVFFFSPELLMRDRSDDRLGKSLFSWGLGSCARLCIACFVFLGGDSDDK